MSLTVNDYGNVIHVTGTTASAQEVTKNILRLGGILWFKPTSVDDVLSINDKNGNPIIQGSCVTAKQSSWWDLEDFPVNGISIDDMDSGEVFIHVKRGIYQAT